MKDEHQSVAKSKREVIAGYLDCFVPRACDENAALGCLEPFNDLDRCVVLGDLLGLPGLNIVDTRRIVAATRDDLVPFLWSMVWMNLDAVFSNAAYFIPTN